MKKTIALFASSRPDGNTAKLLAQVTDHLGIEVVDLTLLNMSTFDYQHRNRNDDFEPLMTRLLGAQPHELPAAVCLIKAASCGARLDSSCVRRFTMNRLQHSSTHSRKPFIISG
ncbi:MAG: hypothetical protein V4603_04440 [Pseudomonadota bacterium]